MEQHLLYDVRFLAIRITSQYLWWIEDNILAYADCKEPSYSSLPVWSQKYDALLLGSCKLLFLDVWSVISFHATEKMFYSYILLIRVLKERKTYATEFWFIQPPEDSILLYFISVLVVTWSQSCVYIKLHFSHNLICLGLVLGYWCQLLQHCWQAGWKLWPFAHLITYGVIPVEQRLLWVDCVELIWVTILST